MAIRCEHCGKLSPDASARCECGYDFSTGEIGLAIAHAKKELDDAQRRIWQGISAFVVLVVALVVAGVIVLVIPMSQVMGGIVVAAAALPCTVVGAVALGRGVGASVAASRRLRAAEARKQLPVARVVE